MAEEAERRLRPRPRRFVLTGLAALAGSAACGGLVAYGVTVAWGVGGGGTSGDLGGLKVGDGATSKAASERAVDSRRRRASSSGTLVNTPS